MQHYVTPLYLTGLALAHIAAGASVAAALRTREDVQAGWRLVGPSGTHWFAVIGCWAFGILTSWVWLFVGSARHDAEHQMRMAFLLAACMCAVATWAGMVIARLRRMGLRWRGGDIHWRAAGGEEKRETFANFELIRRGLDGALHIRFKDGVVLKLDFYAKNATEFLVRFSEELGRDVY